MMPSPARSKGMCLGCLLVLMTFPLGKTQEKMLEKITLTCVLPAVENKSLDESPYFGDFLSNLARQQSDFCELFLMMGGERTCRSNPEMCASCPVCNMTFTDLGLRCSAVLPGSFCPFSKDKENPGYYCGPFASIDGLVCPLGFSCPGGPRMPIACPKGTHCGGAKGHRLQGTAVPQDCPIGHFCPIAAAAILCDPKVDPLLIGTSCIPDEDGRRMLPQVCLPGQYCPPGGINITCPEGHYCPEGTHLPIHCGYDFMTRCPAGSPSPQVGISSLVHCSFSIAVILGFLYTTPWWINNPRLRRVRYSIFLVTPLLLYLFEYTQTRYTLTSPPLFIATMCGVFFWGAVVAPKTSALLGPIAGVVVDVVSAALLVVGGFSLAGDTMAGVFVAMLIVSMCTLRETLSGDRIGMRPRFTLMAGLFCAVVASIGHRIGGGAALFWVVVVVVWLIYLIARSTWKNESLFCHTRSDGGRKASGMGETLVEPLLGVGDAEVGQYARRESALPGISLELHHVGLTLPNGMSIFRDVSLRIPAGDTVAILGPSGCGKSSVTNVLSGRAGYGTVTGQIKINGQRGEGIEVKSLKQVIGFVPQDDVLHRMLTVRENVEFQAELRMPWRGEESAAKRHEDVTDEVNRVLQSVGLGEESLQCTKIGDETERGVSGGQRKRVSIAMEYVAKPSLLFLDEPTSGLDSTTSYTVVDMIAKAAKATNCTTCAVIHQPRYEMLLLFDRLVLLAAGGCVVYAGPTKDAQRYFEQVLGVVFPKVANPADIMMDAVTPEAAADMMHTGRMLPLVPLADLPSLEALKFGQLLGAKWKKHADDYEQVELSGMDVPLPNLHPLTCQWGQETWVQMKRALMQTRTTFFQSLAFNACLLTFAILSLCLLAPPKTFQDSLTHPAASIFVVTATQGVAGMRVFGGPERFVAWREAGTGIRIMLYFFGRDIVALIEIALSATIFCLVYGPMGPLIVPRHVMFWMAFALIYCVYGMAYVVSIVLEENTAQLSVVLLSSLSLAFAGWNPQFVKLIRAPGGVGMFIMALSPIRWAYGFIIHQHLTGGTSFSNPLVQLLSSTITPQLGLPFTWMRNATDHGFDYCAVPTRERWLGSDPMSEDAEVPPISLVCGLTQLFLLGAYFRFVALLSLFTVSEMRAAGGGSIITVAGAEKVGGRLSMVCHLVQGIWLLFVLAFTQLSLSILLDTF